MYSQVDFTRAIATDPSAQFAVDCYQAWRQDKEMEEMIELLRPIEKEEDS